MGKPASTAKPNLILPKNALMAMAAGVGNHAQGDGVFSHWGHDASGGREPNVKSISRRYVKFHQCKCRFYTAADNMARLFIPMYKILAMGGRQC